MLEDLFADQIKTILNHKLINDGRPMYWANILKQFNPYLISSIPDNLEKWQETGATEFCKIPSLSKNGIYLSGYFQSPKYFDNPVIQNEIKSMIKPDIESLNILNQKYTWLINNKDRVVVVHARRTDYLRNKDIIDFHGPLNAEYYINAINKMSSYVKNPIFLLISDDVTYWLPLIKDIDNLYHNSIYMLDNESEIETLALIQQFSYFIIANSSFSWWGAWLSDNPLKVIAPSRWFGPTGPKNYKDIYVPSWELL
jgi:hypothetical protein